MKLAELVHEVGRACSWNSKTLRKRWKSLYMKLEELVHAWSWQSLFMKLEEFGEALEDIVHEVGRACAWSWQRLYMKLAERMHEVGRDCTWRWQSVCMKLAELVHEVGRGQVMSLPFPLAPHQRRVVTLHPVHSWRSDLLHDTFFSPRCVDCCRMYFVAPVLWELLPRKTRVAFHGESQPGGCRSRASLCLVCCLIPYEYKYCH